MPQYIVGLDEFVENQDIQHYGRIGMKWYQHKYGEDDGRARYMEKGLNRLAKDKTKSEKDRDKIDYYKSKAEYHHDKATAIRNKLFLRFGPIDTFRASRNDAKARKNAKKAYKIEKRTYKAVKDGKKTAKKMMDMFGDINMSDMNKEQIAAGEKFALSMINDRKRAA